MTIKNKRKKINRSYYLTINNSLCLSFWKKVKFLFARSSTLSFYIKIKYNGKLNEIEASPAILLFAIIRQYFIELWDFAKNGKDWDAPYFAWGNILIIIILTILLILE